MTDIPVVDISALRDSDVSARQRVAGSLGKAAREVGFFYVTGHGIEREVMNRAFAASKSFFALPHAQKAALSIKRSAHNVGYGELEDEQLDPDGAPDCKESFNIGLEPARGREGDEQPGRGVNFWPDLPGWRDIMLDYYDRCLAAGRLIHRGFSLDLGVPETFFDDKLDTPFGILRLLRYPPRRPDAPARLAAGAHTDYGNITLLGTDSVAGLQVRRRGGGWIDAPSMEGALLCNIGDCLMRWTGDVYVSTPHRVIMPAAERYSIAFFLDANPEAIVETLPGMPAKYPPITAGAYVKQRLDATYASRKG